ncbi:hypothetical protein [Streptomyces sp. NPDC090445]|uniref:hypothetical protein n=1 Tax=Streptomyces sp. NPDC090445 TaxID=3365963 RepID=UPI00381EEE66
MSSLSQHSAAEREPDPARDDDTSAPVPVRAAGADEADRAAGAAAERLLSELAPLPHHRRVCAAVDHVRALPPAEVPGLLGVLADPDRQVPHVRALALICARSVTPDPAHGSGLTAVLTAGLTDPHRYVRTQALTALAAGLITPDPALLLADHVTGAARRDLIGRLRRPAADSADPGAVRRLADTLVEPLRETWGDHEAARLLPGCSAETVRRLLPLLHHALGCWPALTRRHPLVVWEWLAGEAEALPEAARENWWRFRAAPALTALAAVQPVRVLDLFALHGPARLPHGLLPHLPRFLTHDPRRVARLWREDRLDLVLTSLTDAAARRFVRSLPEDELLATLRHPRSTVTALAAVLRALPPGRRGPVLDATRSRSPRDARLADAMSAAGLERPPMPQDLLRLLPCDAAAPHVRHALSAARERGATPAELFLLRGLLPYEDAAPALLAGTRRSDADERGAAWRALVACAARSRRPAAVAGVVAELADRLRSEQDPIRTQALGALSSVPPGLFAEAAPAALHRIVTDTLEARDRSFGSVTALATVARRVACAHGAHPGTPGAALLAWAVETLLRVDGAGRTPACGPHTLGTLRRNPPAEAVEALVGGLRPLVTAALDAGDPDPVLTLAETLAGPGGSGAARRGARSRPEGTPWLWTAVERVLTGTSDERVARRSADLWLAPGALRRSRVRALLAEEPSAIVLPQVVETVARHADDLLPVLLAHPLDTPPAGRFHPAEHIGRPHERYPLPPVVRAAHRWTGAACTAVADWLVAGLRTRHPDAVTATGGAGAGSVSVPGDALLRALAAVPGSAGIAEVRALATARDVPTAEAALAALPYADRPALVLPDLLARAADDRARVAVYAIGRVCPHVPPVDLAARFRPVLARSEGSKVTSRKEIVRLAADRLPAALAGEALVAAFTASGQHPDVRAAAVARAAALVALEPVAACLDGIARQGSAAERAALLRVSPWQLSGPARQRYATLVNGVCHALLTAPGAVHAEGAASTAAADEGQKDGPTPQQTAETCRVLYRWAQAEPSTVHFGLLPRLVADPRTAGPVWEAAAVTVVDAARQDPGGAGTVLAELLAELLAAGAGEQHHAAVRHRVEALTRELERWAGQRLPDTCRPVWERACALLVAQDATLRLGVGLRTTLGPGAGSDHEAWLRTQARLVRDRPLLAARTARSEARRAGRPTASGLRGDLARSRSAAAPDALFTGLYVLARAEEELGAARSAGGDTATPLTALTELCGHPSPDVRDAAAEAAGRP